MNEEISEELRGKLIELARLQDGEAGDLTDEHERWELYRVAIEDGIGVAELFDLISLEPDSVLASSVVIQMVERSAPDERRSWVARLPAEGQGYADGRVVELETVDKLCSGEIPHDQVTDSLENWSNWLQLRITEFVEDTAVLRILAEQGRTKRVRRQAAEALHHLCGGPPGRFRLRDHRA
ncbi:hypothetical protein [Nonomuraea guangzhouensis]|uniref:HEAT repeat domain-containing protein n=1 Tax=Nonomuraea guangzhouensis TaxID=1291555 RepID=A0ABW4GNZ5_9ACTN|nr:hypothetical protein [Nonomuraea guangzhouensis]